MARETRRVLIPPQRLSEAAGDGRLALSEDHSHYLVKVLRYGPGARFAVVDGAGHLWDAELLDHRHARLLQPLSQPLCSAPAPRPALVLAASVVKRDFDLVVRMAVELGVDRLVPLHCERTAVHGQLRPERWHSIASEAAEQCERLWLPKLDQPMPLAEMWRVAPADHCFWATTRNDGLPLLQQELQACRSSGAAEVWLACGPEGGWSPQEEATAQAEGWQPVQLGPTILRSSTACVAGAALLSSWRAALG